MEISNDSCDDPNEIEETKEEIVWKKVIELIEFVNQNPCLLNLDQIAHHRDSDKIKNLEDICYTLKGTFRLLVNIKKYDWELLNEIISIIIKYIGYLAKILNGQGIKVSHLKGLIMMINKENKFSLL